VIASQVFDHREAGFVHRQFDLDTRVERILAFAHYTSAVQV
jgi:hypothetical protein